MRLDHFQIYVLNGRDRNIPQPVFLCAYSDKGVSQQEEVGDVDTDWRGPDGVPSSAQFIYGPVPWSEIWKVLGICGSVFV